MRIYYENELPDNMGSPESVDTDISSDNGNTELIEAINALNESIQQQNANYEEEKEIQAQKENEETEENTSADSEAISEEDLAKQEEERQIQEQKEIELQEWRDDIKTEITELKETVSMFMMIVFIFFIWKHISAWRTKATGRL